MIISLLSLFHLSNLSSSCVCLFVCVHVKAQQWYKVLPKGKITLLLPCLKNIVCRSLVLYLMMWHHHIKHLHNACQKLAKQVFCFKMLMNHSLASHPIVFPSLLQKINMVSLDTLYYFKEGSTNQKIRNGLWIPVDMHTTNQRQKTCDVGKIITLLVPTKVTQMLCSGVGVPVNYFCQFWSKNLLLGCGHLNTSMLWSVW